MAHSSWANLFLFSSSIERGGCLCGAGLQMFGARQSRNASTLARPLLNFFALRLALTRHFLSCFWSLATCDEWAMTEVLRSVDGDGECRSPVAGIALVIACVRMRRECAIACVNAPFWPARRCVAAWPWWRCLSRRHPGSPVGCWPAWTDVR